MTAERSQLRQTDGDRAEASIRPLRILEIGGPFALFTQAVPQQTELYWTEARRQNWTERTLGPWQMFGNLRRLRRGEFDLLVVHTMQYPPWHLRTILTVVRDWKLRSPFGLFAIFAWRFVHLFHKVPIAVLDLGDSCRIGAHNFFLLDRCRAFFKRELPSDYWLAFCKSSYPNFPGRRWRSGKRNQRRVEKLKPISLGCLPVTERFSAPEKRADIFFAGDIAANNTARIAGLQELAALADQGYAVDIATQRLSRSEFLTRMSAAWLAWSPAGLGWECKRHYEAPLVGTVPLINYPTIMRHRPLLEDEHCVLYGVEAGGLADAARRALADKPRLRRMASAAADHVAAHHSDRARAEYVTTTVLEHRLDGTLAPQAGRSRAAKIASHR